MGEWHFTPWSLQRRILASTATYTVSPSGTGTGKTAVVPAWLYDRVRRWPSDEYLVVGADDNSIQAQFVNKPDGLVRIFCDELGIGDYISSTNLIRLRSGGTVYLRSAKAPRTLHSIHARAVVIDEAGLIDDVAADVALGRAAAKQGDYLALGYPMSGSGWYRDLIERGEIGDPLVNVLRVASEDSPFVPRRMVEEARRRLPPWKFDLIWRGLFTRALGAILDPMPVPERCLHDITRDRMLAANRDPGWIPSDDEVEREALRSVQRYGGTDGGWAL